MSQTKQQIDDTIAAFRAILEWKNDKTGTIKKPRVEWSINGGPWQPYRFTKDTMMPIYGGTARYRLAREPIVRYCVLHKDGRSVSTFWFKSAGDAQLNHQQSIAAGCKIIKLIEDTTWTGEDKRDD